MKECLHCKKEFQEKKATAKYCSTSCRVMYNRNPFNPKKQVTELKLEVLYTSLLEMVGKINQQPMPNSLDAPAFVGKITHDEPPMFIPKPKIRRSYENYQQLKLDCESVEAWQVLKAEILASELSTKQKALLTS